MDKPLESSRGQSILIVDDTPANLHVLTGMLKEQGYRVRPALNGKMAIQGAQAEPPDLILLDINMPEMNGYQVCERLKTDKQLKDIPVIFISALNETADKVKAFTAGGVDYVTKPFQFEEVAARVKTHLEIQRQKHVLQENYQQLHKLESFRDGLVHMIVHDIRNSLTGIYGYIELLRNTEEGKISPDGQEYAQRALNGLESLVEMTSTLLDVSKIESGQMKLNFSEWDMAGLTRDILKKMDSLRETRRFTIVMDPQDGRFILESDRILIGRVIQNLMSNALKFTPPDGEISIVLKSLQDHIQFSVKDTGPGIPAEYHKKIFEKFGQVESQTGNCPRSTGLGLTFCKMTVEAHGGRISVDSEVNKGSTFWFILPKKQTLFP
ncbi:MAG: hybrid sensor histidine kinase/response regulator [Candidatus Omnitrophica bacterium]|nr:hybrid sensor histidine kinase/response regulator [Candidatus Omnitrophota bacterium]